MMMEEKDEDSNNQQLIAEMPMQQRYIAFAPAESPRSARRNCAPNHACYRDAVARFCMRTIGSFNDDYTAEITFFYREMILQV